MTFRIKTSNGGFHIYFGTIDPARIARAVVVLSVSLCLGVMFFSGDAGASELIDTDYALTTSAGSTSSR